MDAEEKHGGPEEKWSLLEQYDLRDVKIEVANIGDMNIHRKMVSTLFLDNVVWETARLQRHVWVAACEKDVYRDRELYSSEMVERGGRG